MRYTCYQMHKAFCVQCVYKRTFGNKLTMCVPFIDWNGNGRIDPSDIAISLAIAEEEEKDQEDEEEQEHGNCC